MVTLDAIPAPHGRVRPREKTSNQLPRMAVITLAVMFSLGIAAIFMVGSAQETRTTMPLLNGVTTHSLEEGTVVVSGANFTPGGDVFIAIQDMWGVTSFETRWTTASEHTPSISRSDDPNLGFHPGGAVYETFDHLCGQVVTVRALDAQTGTFSNPLDLDVDCGA